MPRPRILVVDDEPALRRTLEVNLGARGYDVELAPNGEHALRAAAAQRPDAVLLDLGLPDLDGVEVLERLRGWTEVPVIVLTARDAEAQKVRALDAGADDYVTKPFGMDELVARLRAALRRSSVDPGAEVPVVRTPHFTVDLAAHRVLRQDEVVHLTPNEWGIVEVLARHAGRLVSQRTVLQTVWGPQYGDETHYLRTYLNQIRRKLEPDPSAPRYFVTEPGSGYRFEGAIDDDVDESRPPGAPDGVGAPSRHDGVPPPSSAQE